MSILSDLPLIKNWKAATPNCHSPTRSLDADALDIAEKLINGRRNTSPKRLVEPGPSEAEIERLLSAAAAAPDHGVLTPWRFVIIPPDKRVLLADAFVSALTDRDADAAPDQIVSASEKAYRAPFVMLAIARLGHAVPDISMTERLISLGAAIQNILLTAHAMGFGAGLTTGESIGSSHIAKLFKLADGEKPIYWINIGTVTREKTRRSLPHPREFTSML